MVSKKLWSGRHTVRMSNGARDKYIEVPHGKFTERPSRLRRNDGVRDDTFSSTTDVSLTTSGRIVSEWAATGDSTNVGEVGSTIGPPTERL